MLGKPRIFSQHLGHGMVVPLSRLYHPELGCLVDGVDGSGVIAAIVSDGGGCPSFRCAGVSPLDGRRDGRLARSRSGSGRLRRMVVGTDAGNAAGRTADFNL